MDLGNNTSRGKIALFRSFSTYLLTLFLFSILAACGGGGGGTPANTAPTADAGTLAVNEDTSGTGTLTGTDPNTADTLSYSIATNGTSGIATVDDPATGAYTYVPNADANGTDTFTFVINDGTANSAEATVTVTIAAVNDAPVGVDDAYVTTEGVPLVIAAAGVLANDTDVDAGDTLTAVIVNSGTNGTAVLAADGSFTYTTTVPTFSGADSFTYVVNDTAPSASATTTVNITINSINNVPFFTKGANETSDEDAGGQTVVGWATAINAGAPDETGQVLTFNVTNDDNTLFVVQPAIAANGDLTYTAAADANGSATVTVSLSDNGGVLNGGVDTSADQFFFLTINAVNDAPSFTTGADETVLEDAIAQSVVGWATAISTGPADESGQAIASFNVSNNNNALFSAQPAIANNGDLTYTPAADANGTATVTVSLTDNGGTLNGGVDTSADQTFVINVTAQNDAPTASAGSPQSVNEQVVVNLDGSLSSDVDDGGAGLSYAWTQTAGTTVILSDATAQSPSFTTPAIAAGETLTFQISVDDGIATAVTDTVDITLSTAGHLVGHIDDAPQTVDLAAEGTTDWAHWGEGATTAKDEKAGVDDIGAVSRIVGTEGNFTNFGDGNINMSWTGGTPTATSTGTIEGVFTTNGTGGSFINGGGYTITISNVGLADQTVKLYMGVFNAVADITATLSDTSASPVTVSVDNTVSTDAASPALQKVVTFNFAANSAASTLTLDVQVNADPGVDANLSLTAVTLSTAKAAVPTFTPPNGTGTDSLSVGMATDTPNADIFFTTNNTAPTIASTRYTTAITLTANTTVRAITAVGGYANSTETNVAYTVGASGANGAQLAGHIEDIPALPAVNLETEGTTDWVHLGLTATNDVNQKIGGGVISGIGTIGSSVTEGQFNDGPIAFDWTNGNPTAITTDTINGRFYQVALASFNAGTQGFSFTVTPGDTNPHTLKLYLGAYQSTISVTASLPDGQSYSGTFAAVDSALAGGSHKVVVLDFTAAAAGVMTVTVVISGNTGVADPNVTFDGVTLQ